MTMRLLKPGAVVLAAVLGSVGLTTSAVAGPPAVSDQLISTHVEIQSVGTQPLDSHDSFTVRGQVIYTDPEDGQEYAADGTVTLERQFRGDATWTTLGSDDMSVFYPVFSFSATALRNATYRVDFVGDDRYAPSTQTLSIRVARNVTAKLTEPRENVFYLSGRVSPSYIGRPVTLMRKKCSSCAWHAYTTKATNELSRYRFKLPLPKSGSFYFRARVAGDVTFVTAYSTTYQVMRLF